MSLPRFTVSDKDLMMLQTRWASILDPIIAQPINSGVLLPNISLVTGLNQVAHKLQRRLQGRLIVRQRAAATLFDQQDTNPTPDTLLFLNSSAPVVVDLFVF